MLEKASDLPDFVDPPVNETVLSIQFAPIASFGIPHFGLYWSRIRSEFRRIHVLPALPPAKEQFSERQPTAMQLKFVASPEARCWFMDESGERLIQVQRDRFIHNWRQVTGLEKYPRYPAVRETMYRSWLGFTDFLKAENLEPVQVNQCEVTYVNHVEYGKGWTGFGELNRVVAPWSGKNSGSFLPTPEHVSIESHYLLPNNLGRLHIEALPVVRGRDSKEVLQITLTARGAPVSTEAKDVFDWLDLGRQWVVKGFADFTSEEVQRLWGRQK